MKTLRPGQTYYSRDEDPAALTNIVSGVKAMGISTGRPLKMPEAAFRAAKQANTNAAAATILARALGVSLDDLLETEIWKIFTDS